MGEKWAMTLKYNPNDLTSDELKTKYEIFRAHLMGKKDITIEKFIYEDLDRKGRPTKLHVHGILTIKRGVYRKLLEKDNYHLKLKTYDNRGWNHYINKNQSVKLVNNSAIPDRTLSPAIPDTTYNLFIR